MDIQEQPYQRLLFCLPCDKLRLIKVRPTDVARVVHHGFIFVGRLFHGVTGLKSLYCGRWRGEAPPPNENSYTSQMVRTIKYFAELK